MNKKILILTFTDLTSDARIQRQIKALESEYDLLVCAKRADKEYLRFIPATENMLSMWSLLTVFRAMLVPMVWLIQYIGWEKFKNGFFNWMRYWSVQRISLRSNLIKHEFDLIIANDLDTLPIAAYLKEKKNIPLVFDAHEYYPKQFEQNNEWVIKEQPFIFYLCYNYLKCADLVFTVSDGLLEEYYNTFNINPVILNNAHPLIHDIKPSLINENKIKIVHQGGAIKGRNIERMIRVSELLGENYQFDFYLIPVQKQYFEELKQLAASMDNVNIFPPLMVKDLVREINKYDFGLYILEPINFNHKHALPNKLFEFIQARLAIAIGPSPEMQKIVEYYDIGVVSNDFSAESLAEAIGKLSVEDLRRFKNNTNKAAIDLNAEANAFLIRNEISKLINRND